MTVMADVRDEDVSDFGELCWHFGLGGTLPLPAIRHCVAAWLVGVADAVIEDLQLVVTELVTSAYEHGRMPGQIRITRPGTDVVRVEVDDCSRTLPEFREVFGTTSARAGAWRW
jgi:hypothetical protein